MLPQRQYAAPSNHRVMPRAAPLPAEAAAAEGSQVGGMNPRPPRRPRKGRKGGRCGEGNFPFFPQAQPHRPCRNPCHLLLRPITSGFDIRGLPQSIHEMPVLLLFSTPDFHCLLMPAPSLSLLSHRILLAWEEGREARWHTGALVASDELQPERSTGRHGRNSLLLLLTSKKGM